MSLRILVIDDEDEYLTRISRRLKGGLADNPWGAGVEVVELHSDLFPDAVKLREKVGELSHDRWDAILVDVKLFTSAVVELPGLLLPIDLIRAFRENNHSAIALVFSGNIQDHLQSLFEQSRSGGTGVRGQVERHIRSIISLGIVDFSAKHKVADDAIGHLLNPPWMLRLEREFLRNPKAVMLSSMFGLIGMPEDSDAVTFEDLARMLRRPGQSGELVAKMASEFGVASLVDLYS